MVYKCILCNNKSKTTKNPQSRISFHSFPTNPDLREKWIKITGVEDILMKPSIKICSVHFSEDSYLPMFPKSKGLKRSAVPSLSLNNSVLNTTMPNNAAVLNSPEFLNNIPTKISRGISPINNLSTSLYNTIFQPTIGSESLSNCAPTKRKKLYSHPRYIGDCTEEHVSMPKGRTNNLFYLKRIYLLQTKKIKCLQQQNRNLKKKMMSLKSLLNECKNKG